jgi:hypothetical protein
MQINFYKYIKILQESAMTNSTAGAITGVNGSVAAFVKKV